MSARGNGGRYEYYACSGRQKHGPKACHNDRCWLLESDGGEDAGNPVNLLRPLTEPRCEDLAVLVERRGILDWRDVQLCGYRHVGQIGDLRGHRRFVASVIEAGLQKQTREVARMHGRPVPRARKGVVP